jgi:acyl-CoA synthetase (AMP-forming)/AMP-acid ligase II
MINFISWLFKKTGDDKKIAVFSGDDEISYSDLYSKIKGVSNKINKLIGYDKNVLLISDNSIFFLISYLSIIGSGNVVIPLKYDKNLDIGKIIIKTDSKNIFIQEGKKDILKNHSFLNILSEREIDETKLEKGDIFGEYPENKLALINYTSGSSGDPEGVMITHKNLISNSESIIEGLSLTKQDKIMVLLPFSYCFGASLFHTHLRVGGGIVLSNNFLLSNKVLDELLERKCTGIAGVPTTFKTLLGKTRLKDMKFPDIRCVQQAGGKLESKFILELIDIFGRDNLYIMYGQTEATARLSILNPKYLDTKLGSVGNGIKGVKIKIINSEGGLAKIGEEGEIYASGENIMGGYYKNEKLTKYKIIDGYLKTGDIGIMDSGGFIYITGRKEDFIKSRGYRVDAKHVEKVVLDIPGVIGAAVVGVKDDMLGERIILYYSGDKNVDDTLVKEYCSKNLKNYELPLEIMKLKELPLNRSLKVDYAKLKRGNI